MDADTLVTPPAGDSPAPPGEGAPQGRPRRRRRRTGTALAAGAAGLAVVALVALIASQISSNPTIVRSPLIGKPAPTFELPGVDGGVVRSSDFAGRPYVINFWATWCVACRKEHPYLMSFYQTWAPKGLGMVGIVYNDDMAKVRDFRAEMNATGSYPDVMDPGGRTALDFGVYGVPETFVVDANGIVVAKLIGQAMPGSLDRILAGSPRPAESVGPGYSPTQPQSQR